MSSEGERLESEDSVVLVKRQKHQHHVVFVLDDDSSDPPEASTSSNSKPTPLPNLNPLDDAIRALLGVFPDVHSHFVAL